VLRAASPVLACEEQYTGCQSGIREDEFRDRDLRTLRQRTAATRVVTGSIDSGLFQNVESSQVRCLEGEDRCAIG